MSIKTATIDGITFSFINEKEFDSIYHEIFSYKIYQFTADTASPFILDCGANIGISVLFFKKLYPQAKIIAFEPNPDTFKLLELNVRQNNLRDVELVNAAISDNLGEIDFYVSKGASPTHSADTGVKPVSVNSEEFESIKVSAVRLSSYITRNVDLLKLDIEGMEERVLREIEGKLHLIKEIRLEFHSGITEDNNIERISSLLRRGKFKFTRIGDGLKRFIYTYIIKNTLTKDQKMLLKKTNIVSLDISIIYAHRSLIYIYLQCWIFYLFNRVRMIKLLKTTFLSYEEAVASTRRTDTSG